MNIHSSKQALLACHKEKGPELSAAGRAALIRQDARIYSWRKADAEPVQGKIVQKAMNMSARANMPASRYRRVPS